MSHIPIPTGSDSRCDTYPTSKLGLVGCLTLVAVLLHSEVATSKTRFILPSAAKAKPAAQKESNAKSKKPTDKFDNKKFKLLVAPNQTKMVSNGMTGHQMYELMSGMSVDEREKFVNTAAQAGMLPKSFLKLTDVTIIGKDAKGRLHRLTVQVTPDYLALGTDQDPFRVPMRPGTAQTIADNMGFMLPTTKIVNEIYHDARFTLKPQFLKVSSAMSSPQYFWRHNQMIETQLKGKQKGLLVAGHKKDIVVTKQLSYHPNQLAIYGWHTIEGTPVQPLSLVHGARYVDYSHGVRFVSKQAWLDGIVVDLPTMLRDKNLAPILSDEGAISAPAYRAASAYPAQTRK